MRRNSFWLAITIVAIPTIAVAEPSADFTKSDTNGNQVLERTEFFNFVNLRAAAGDTMARRVVSYQAYGTAFSTVDKNSDGVVTNEELQDVLSRLSN
ncbi:MAG: hypothetical protein AAGG69_05700 [Pseudomonadota bacterium]